MCQSGKLNLYVCFDGNGKIRMHLEASWYEYFAGLTNGGPSCTWGFWKFWNHMRWNTVSAFSIL